MGLEESRSAIREIDEKMAALFVERMQVVREVAAYKAAHDLPVADEMQEARVREELCALVEDVELRPFYLSFLQATMDVSKDWQHYLRDESLTLHK